MRRFLIIANPAAGSGRAPALAQRAAAMLERRGAGVLLALTDAPGHALQLARDAEFEGDQAVVVAGGDGTINEVAHGLLERPETGPRTIAILPAGTGDALARDLGIDQPKSALEALATSHTIEMDVAEVRIDGERRYAVSSIAWGAAARINRRAEKLRWLGRARYEAAAVIELLAPRLADDLAVRQGRQAGRFLLGVVCLTRFTGRGMLVAPDARLDDGLLDLVEILRGPRLALLSLLMRVFDGRHMGSPLVQTQSVRQLDLELQPGSYLNLDGEVLMAREVHISLLPRALRIIAPQGRQITPGSLSR